MEKIIVEIHWCDKNFSCVWGTPEFGSVIVTNKTLDGLKQDFISSLQTQINDMLADGEYVPEWLASGDYTVEYDLHISAILRNAEQFTTMAAISRACGINQKQLTHYASSLKEPRPAQRERIISGLHRIGEAFLAIR